MKRYELVPTREVRLPSGALATPAKPVATIVCIESDRPLDLINLLRSQTAVLRGVNDDEVEDGPDLELDPALDLEEPEEGVFDGVELAPEQLASLQAAGVTDLESAQSFLNANRNFESLNGIGRATSRKLEEAVAKKLQALENGGDEEEEEEDEDD